MPIPLHDRPLLEALHQCRIGVAHIGHTQLLQSAEVPPQVDSQQLFVHLSQSFDLTSYSAAASLDVFTAAVVGGLGSLFGGVLGAVIKGKQYYRDTRGYCYYVDEHGNPVYDYEVRC